MMASIIEMEPFIVRIVRARLRRKVRSLMVIQCIEFPYRNGRKGSKKEFNYRLKLIM